MTHQPAVFELIQISLTLTFLLSMEVTCSQATLLIMGFFVDRLVSWLLSSAGDHGIEWYKTITE